MRQMFRILRWSINSSKNFTNYFFPRITRPTIFAPIKNVNSPEAMKLLDKLLAFLAHCWLCSRMFHRNRKNNSSMSIQLQTNFTYFLIFLNIWSQNQGKKIVQRARKIDQTRVELRVFRHWAWDERKVTSENTDRDTVEFAAFFVRRSAAFPFLSPEKFSNNYVAWPLLPLSRSISRNTKRSKKLPRFYVVFSLNYFSNFPTTRNSAASDSCMVTLSNDRWKKFRRHARDIEPRKWKLSKLELNTNFPY